MSEKPLIKDCLFILNLYGLNPRNCSNFSKVRTILSELLFMFFCFEIWYRCFKYWKGLNSMQDVATSISVYQVAFKALSLALNRKDLVKILNIMEQFWTYDRYGLKLLNKIESSIIAVKNALKFLTVIAIVATLIYILQTVLSSIRILPIQTYHPTNINKSPAYELMYLLEILFILTMFPLAMAVDVIFLSLIMVIIFELKIINEGIANIPIDAETQEDDKSTLWEIYQLIDHHNLVLECIKGIKDVYYYLLLKVFLLDMICICFGLLCMVAYSSPTIILKYGVFVLYYMIQIFLYCGGGTLLITESANIAAAVYNTDWWVKTQPLLRNSYVLMIQRSNKVEKLTAGGMFNLDLESFTKILRTALSFFTLIKAVYKT